LAINEFLSVSPWLCESQDFARARSLVIKSIISRRHRGMEKEGLTRMAAASHELLSVAPWLCESQHFARANSLAIK
jgi:hypothetical protein